MGGGDIRRDRSVHVDPIIDENEELCGRACTGIFAEILSVCHEPQPVRPYPQQTITPKTSSSSSAPPENNQLPAQLTINSPPCECKGKKQR